MTQNLWNITPYGMVAVNQRLGAIYSLYFRSEEEAKQETSKVNSLHNSHTISMLGYYVEVEWLPVLRIREILGFSSGPKAG
jgi:hypothetical protein